MSARKRTHHHKGAISYVLLIGTLLKVKGDSANNETTAIGINWDGPAPGEWSPGLLYSCYRDTRHGRMNSLLGRTEQGIRASKSWPWLSSALLFSSSPIQAVLIPLEPTTNWPEHWFFLAWISLEREGGLKSFCPFVPDDWFGNVCKPQAPGGRCQGRGGWSIWTRHSGSHPTCPGAQRCPKGSHSIQIRVNKFTPALILSLNLKTRLLGVIV